MPQKKIRCTFKQCKDAAQRIVGDCGFCNGHFCGKHRLLEDHKCDGLEDCKKQSHERNAAQLEAERTQVIRGLGFYRKLKDPAREADSTTNTLQMHVPLHTSGPLHDMMDSF
ncbi:an1-type zinc finger protein [Colletotrichum camelliae]|nr:an1-type zinc finger protein [Colletotrichum camelliae]